MNFSKNNSGIINLLLLLLITFIIIVVATGMGKIKLNNPNPTASPTITGSPISSSTPSPTSTYTPTPNVKPTTETTITPSTATYTGSLGNGLSTISVNTEIGTFTAYILSVDLNSTRVITDTDNENDCGNGCPVMALANYVSRSGGYAGVNGTYFCPAAYPECSSKSNSFDFPVYNSRLGRWINGGNLFWNSRAMVYFDGSGAHYLQNANSFGGGINAGIVNYPGLLDGGNIQIDDNQSGLSDKQKAKGTKVGLGIKNSSNIIIVIAMNVNMQEFAYVFKSLGAQGALNLDTGGSTALYYNGRYILGPGRDLPNAIIFASK